MFAILYGFIISPILHYKSKDFVNVFGFQLLIAKLKYKVI